MKVSDLLAGLFFAVLGLAMIGYGAALPPMPGQRYGAGLFPMLLGLCFLGCGAHLARSGRRSGAALVAFAPWVRDRFLAGNVVLTLALIVLYVLLSDAIGFIPLALAMLLILYLRLDVPPLRGIAVALGATAAIQIGFSHFLRVPLPRGLLEGIIW